MRAKQENKLRAVLCVTLSLTGGFTPSVGSSRNFWRWGKGHSTGLTQLLILQPLSGLRQGVPKLLGSLPGLGNLWSGRVRTGVCYPCLERGRTLLFYQCLWSQAFIHRKRLKVSLAFSTEKQYEFSLCNFFSQHYLTMTQSILKFCFM